MSPKKKTAGKGSKSTSSIKRAKSSETDKNQAKKQKTVSALEKLFAKARQMRPLRKWFANLENRCRQCFSRKGIEAVLFDVHGALSSELTTQLTSSPQIGEEYLITFVKFDYVNSLLVNPRLLDSFCDFVLKKVQVPLPKTREEQVRKSEAFLRWVNREFLTQMKLAESRQDLENKIKRLFEPYTISVERLQRQSMTPSLKKQYEFDYTIFSYLRDLLRKPRMLTSLWNYLESKK